MSFEYFQILVVMPCLVIASAIFFAYFLSWRKRVKYDFWIEHGILIYCPSDDCYITGDLSKREIALIKVKEPAFFDDYEIIDMAGGGIPERHTGMTTSKQRIRRTNWDRFLKNSKPIFLRVKHSRQYDQNFFGSSEPNLVESIDWEDPLLADDFHNYFVPWVQGKA